jgi:hypothetical protein
MLSSDHQKKSRLFGKNHLPIRCVTHDHLLGQYQKSVLEGFPLSDSRDSRESIAARSMTKAMHTRRFRLTVPSFAEHVADEKSAHAKTGCGQASHPV